MNEQQKLSRLAAVKVAFDKAQAGQTPDRPDIARVVARAQAIADAWNASKHASSVPTVDNFLEVLPLHLQPKSQF